MKFMRVMLPVFCLVQYAGAMQERSIDYRGSEYNNPWVYDVEHVFNSIPSDGVHIAARNYRSGSNTPAIPDLHCRYRDCVFHNAGYVGCQCCNFIPVGGLNNHFQGVVRLPEWLGLGNYFLVTGNNPHNDQDTDFGPAAHLFVIKADRHHCDGSFNGLEPCEIIDVVTLGHGEGGYIHPGGIQTCGKYLVVPMEGGGLGRLMLYKFQYTYPNGFSIVKLNVDIEIDQPSCGAAAMTRLADGHFVVAYWRDGGIVMYVSRQTSVESGFVRFGVITTKDISSSTGRWGLYTPGCGSQGISFVNGMDDQLYLITTHNNNSWSPVRKGIDFVALFRVDFPVDESSGFKLTYLSERVVNCGRNADFQAAGGVYVPDQRALSIYGGYHWLKGWHYLCHNFKNSYISLMQFASQA